MSDSKVLSIDHNVNEPRAAAGAFSLAEILSQPQCWKKSLDRLEKSGKLEQVRDRFAHADEWIFIGCGSSYYVALAAAASMSAETGLRAKAVPASEILLYPQLWIGTNKNAVPVLISRSGKTSEVLQAATALKERGIATLAISCTPEQALEHLASETILLPDADEQSTVMTRSFTSMLLTLQALAATIARQHEHLADVRRMTDSADSILQELPSRIREFVKAHHFADYVHLGQGPFYGLACEGALKVTEMSVSYAQAFHTLEFRHGPKSIVGPETLIVFLLSDSGYKQESEALQEVKSLGGTTIAVTRRADAGVRESADLVVELPFGGPGLVGLAPHLFTGQLLGLYTGLQKGLNPDSPRNLSRAVILQ